MGVRLIRHSIFLGCMPGGWPIVGLYALLQMPPPVTQAMCPVPNIVIHWVEDPVSGLKCYFWPHVQPPTTPRFSHPVSMHVAWVFSHLALICCILLPPFGSDPQSQSKQELAVPSTLLAWAGEPVSGGKWLVGEGGCKQTSHPLSPWVLHPTSCAAFMGQVLSPRWRESAPCYQRSRCTLCVTVILDLPQQGTLIGSIPY